ncbi:MAG TPA: MoxR family ATPase, partial [Nakamurella sp.]|nr:MoxR family ATPase [Nakamurella sp.]
RFMMKVLVGYPSATEEFVIVERAIGLEAVVHRVLTPERLTDLADEARRVYLDPALSEYAVRLAGATRDPAAVGLGELSRYLTYGASPRASINLMLAARALAYLRGREYAIPQDLVDLAPDVFRHRLVLSYQALGDDVTADELLLRIMAALPVPDVALSDRH